MSAIKEKISNKYAAPTYYRHFGSIRLEKDELLRLMIEDSERLKANHVYYTIRFSDFSSPDCGVNVSSIYRNNFTPYHDHNYYEFNVVFSGELLEYIDGRSLTLQSGDLLFMAPGVYHVSNPYKKARCYNILFSEPLVRETLAQMTTISSEPYLAALVQNSGFYVFHHMSASIVSLIQKMNVFARREKKYFPFCAPLLECLGRQLLLSLCECPYDSYQRFENPIRQNTPEEIIARQILDYIREHSDSVTLDKLAAYFGYSRSQTERLIEKHSGSTYTVLLHNHRRRNATQLLHNTTLPVSQIARMVGFQSTEHFSRWFKHYVGTSPSVFRKISHGYHE